MIFYGISELMFMAYMDLNQMDIILNIFLKKQKQKKIKLWVIIRIALQRRF